MAGAEKIPPLLSNYARLHSRFPWVFTLVLLCTASAALPRPAAANDQATERFLEDYAFAWSSRSPVPLIRLSQPQTIFAGLAGLERWDHLTQSRAKITLMSEETDLRNQRILLVRREQHDRFVSGTYAISNVVERLVVRTVQGRIRITRYDSVVDDRNDSADPSTWTHDRDGERALMLATQDLASLEQDRCLRRLAGLFKEESPAQMAVELPEPFEERKTAAANAFYVRAACRNLGGGSHRSGQRSSISPEERKKIRADLDHAIVLEPEHNLARILRARLVLEELPRLSGQKMDAELKIALEDTREVERLTPDNQEASTLWHLLNTIEALRQAEPTKSRATRTRIAQELVRSPGRVATEVLRRLGGAQDLYAAGSEALTIAAEFALVDGLLQEASQLLGLLGIRCGDCPGYFYLMGRHAEVSERKSEALGFYAAVLERAPSYRDALWRYASLGLASPREDRNPILGRLNAAMRGLSGIEADYLRVLIIFAQKKRRNEGIVALLAEHVPDTPLPASVRLALVQTLTKR